MLPSQKGTKETDPKLRFAKEIGLVASSSESESPGKQLFIRIPLYDNVF